MLTENEKTWRPGLSCFSLKEPQMIVSNKNYQKREIKLCHNKNNTQSCARRRQKKRANCMHPEIQHIFFSFSWILV